MMKFTVTIGCETEPFTEKDNPGPELVRLLRGIADNLESRPAYMMTAGRGGDLFDLDGKDVGSFEFHEAP